MKKSNFVKKEDVLTVLKSQIEDLSKTSKDEQERGYFNECLIQINEMQVKSELYDQLKGSLDDLFKDSYESSDEKNAKSKVGMERLKNSKALSLTLRVLYGKH